MVTDNILNTDDLFNKATSFHKDEKVIQSPKLQSICTKSKALNRLNEGLSTLLNVAIKIEEKKINAKCVDGLIIGTGEADFTQGNTIYILNYEGEVFQLMDVPGIEGNEKKYEHLVCDAIAKAHLVFYVNGTNKKPEKKTAEKIHSYLKRGTNVFPIMNIRGNADSYEFEEDRISLNNCDTKKSLEQTMDILSSVLNQKILLQGCCIQGLLAFSSLAMDTKSYQTTIHPYRENDLRVQQRNYLKFFKSNKEMFDFSQISVIAQVLHNKIKNFKDDIIESNKNKVAELLSENVRILLDIQYKHTIFVEKLDPEFNKCKRSISDSIKSFERKIKIKRKNLYEECFQEMINNADAIVAENYGEKSLIEEKIRKKFQTLKDNLENKLQIVLDDEIELLRDEIGDSIKRLIQDVQRVRFQERAYIDFQNNIKFTYISAELDMDLSWKEWGGILFQVGSYALAGFGIGTAFPVVGNIIGALAGTFIGLCMSAASFFMSKEKRIRKAQATIQEKIDTMRQKTLSEIDKEIDSLMILIDKHIQKEALGYVNNIYANLNSKPLIIIKKQLELMDNIHKQLKEMPYGTLQAIQS